MRIDKTKENIKDKWYLRRIMIHSGVDVVREGESVRPQTRRPSILELMTHVNLWLINLFIDPNRNIGIKVLAGMFLVLPIILTSLFLLSVTGFKFHVNLNYSEHLLLNTYAIFQGEEQNWVYDLIKDLKENVGKQLDEVEIYTALDGTDSEQVKPFVKGVLDKAIPSEYNSQQSIFARIVEEIVNCQKGDSSSVSQESMEQVTSLIRHSQAVSASDILRVRADHANNKFNFSLCNNRFEGEKDKNHFKINTLQDILGSLDSGSR